MALTLFGGVGPLDRRRALRDALAGVALASMNVPQVLGYARIAGTPIVSGLYTLLLPLVAFAIFGSSRHMVVAADSATAAVFVAHLVYRSTLLFTRLRFWSTAAVPRAAGHSAHQT